jgi:hypothetical protein
MYMDDSQITNPESLQTPEALPIRKPLSIKILQAFFLVWGSWGLISSTFDAVGVLVFRMPIDQYSSHFDPLLHPPFNIGAIIIGLGLYHYSKYSLSIARFCIIGPYYFGQECPYIFYSCLLYF